MYSAGARHHSSPYSSGDELISWYRREDGIKTLHQVRRMLHVEFRPLSWYQTIHEGERTPPITYELSDEGHQSETQSTASDEDAERTQGFSEYQNGSHRQQ